MATPLFLQLLKTFQERSHLDEIEVDDLGFCDLLFDKELTVRIWEEPQSEKIIFLAALGPLPQDSSTKDQWLTTLLEANYRWLMTAGSSLSLNPQEATIELARHENIQTIDIDRFEIILEDFVACGLYWMKRLSEKKETTSLSFPHLEEQAAPQGLLPPLQHV